MAPGHSFFVNAGHPINGSGIIEPFSRKAILLVNLLADGDMEAADTSAWIAYNNPTLSKETSDPYEGSRWLKIMYTDQNQPSVYQLNLCTIGMDYRLVGAGRGDGTARPRIDDWAAQLWEGTSSTSWQTFDIEYTAVVTSSPLFRAVALGAGEYAGFDGLALYAL